MSVDTFCRVTNLKWLVEMNISEIDLSLRLVWLVDFEKK